MIIRIIVLLSVFAVAVLSGRVSAAPVLPLEVASSEVRVLPPGIEFRANEVGGLSFSEAVNAQARPIEPAVEFNGATMRIWISFNYYDYDYRARPPVRYLIRANGADWQSGDTTCCDGPQGRYAFPVERERDRAFGGAGYEVVISVGGVDASRGAFTVSGTGGFDNDNNENDNHGFGPRGNLSNNDKK